MKKSKALEIHFQDFESFKKEVKSALAKQKRSIQSKDHIYFESLGAFRSFMTIQKIEILTVIANQEPSSIYDLAKMVDRDFAAVLRDCTSLEGAGFIQLKDKKDKKKTKMPELSFPYTSIVVMMPDNPYQIEFEAAA